MDKKEFQSFCKMEFEARGFSKVKKRYYLFGKNVLCSIELQKSNFSNSYYINFYFYIDLDKEPDSFPPTFAFDVQGRLLAMSKTQTIEGKHFLTSAIEYEKYTEEELRLHFDREFGDRILPPIYQGKQYIGENLGKLYSLTLNRETVLEKLGRKDYMGLLK